MPRTKRQWMKCHGLLCLGVGESIFCRPIGVLGVGVLSLTFCIKIAIMVKGGVVPVYSAKC